MVFGFLRKTPKKEQESLAITTEACVLFLDVRHKGEHHYHYSKHARDEFQRKLCRFRSAVMDEIQKEGGLVVEFVGDGARAVFGVARKLSNPAGAGIKSARALLLRLSKDPFHLGVCAGIAWGTVCFCPIGAPNRRRHKLLGAPCLISRGLCASAEPHTILTDEFTASKVQRDFDVKAMRPVRMPWKEETVPAFQVLLKNP